MSEMANGIIELSNGFEFVWCRGSGDGEIFGSIKKPNGSIVAGMSGWYRTGDPDLAGKVAKRKLLSLAV